MAAFDDLKYELMEEGMPSVTRVTPKDPGSIDPTIVDTSQFEPTEVDILQPHYEPMYAIVKKKYDSNNKIPQEQLIRHAKKEFKTQFPHTVRGDEQIPEDVLNAFVKYIVIASVLRSDPERQITQLQIKEAERVLDGVLLEAKLRHFSKGGKRKKRTRKRKIHKKKSHKKKSKTHRKKHHKKTHHKY
tara:strand:- start:608 stop:1168 length:561 start_codon:yes stop_codon:yes gene_type:complete